MAIVQSISGLRATAGLIGAGTGAETTATAAIVDTISVSDVNTAGLIAVVTRALIKDSYAVTRNLTSTNVDSQGGLRGITTGMGLGILPVFTNSYWDNTLLSPPDERALGKAIKGIGTDVLNTTNDFSIGGIFEEWGNDYVNRATGNLEELSVPPDITTESGTHTQAWNLDAFRMLCQVLHLIPLPIPPRTTILCSISCHYPLRSKTRR